jgi:hypothetical protein
MPWSDDDVLLAVGDLDVAGLVELADVARAEEAVGGHGGLRRLVVLVVAAEDVVALDQQLTVAVEPDLHPG